MQEVFTLLAMAALAALIIAVGGIVVWHFQDAQKAADWAVAYVYPMAKPYNSTHFWLGAQAAFADVEISHVLVDNTTYLLGVRAPQGRQVWLNYSGGPLLVKCNSTVVFDVRAGSASRTLAFRAVCPKASLENAYFEDLRTMLVSYASFVLDYVVHNHSALITAYFKSDGVYIRNNWDRPLIVAVDPPIGAVYNDLTSATSSVSPIVLLPGEEYRLIPMDTAGAVAFTLDNGTTLRLASHLSRWVYSQLEPHAGGWLLWINGVVAHNGSAPAGGESPQGYPFAVWPNGTYQLGDKTVISGRWDGWLAFKTEPPPVRGTVHTTRTDKYSVPYANVNRRLTLYVYPGTQLSVSGSQYSVTVSSNDTVVRTEMQRAGSASLFRGFGGASPFLAYEALAVYNGTAVAVYWYDLRYDAYDPRGVYRDYLTAPGTKIVRAPGRTGALVLYADSSIWVAVRDVDRYWFRSIYMAFGTAFDVSRLIINGREVFDLKPVSGSHYQCWVRTNGYRDHVGFNGYWSVECYYYNRSGYYEELRKVTPTVYVNFSGSATSFTARVYKDGDLVATYGPMSWRSALPDYVPIIVAWDGVATRMWGLPRGIATVYGYAPSNAVPTHGGYVYNRVVYAVRITDMASYRYTLEVRAGYKRDLVGQYARAGGDALLLYNITAAGQLTLYLWGEPVAYDAYYGHGYAIERAQLPPSNNYFQPGGACVPSTYYQRLPGQKLTGLKYHYAPDGSIAGYSIKLERPYREITVGCGVYSERTVWKTVEAATVDGTTLFVTDTKSDKVLYCSLNTQVKPRECGDGIVRCECERYREK
ncbi:MAG: hypothetical protein QXN04_09485 [Pyrobaculum sp.]